MKNKKLCLILIVLCFILPLFNIFPVVKGDSGDNFYAISKSNKTTQWILTPLADFYDDINTDYWNLGDVSEDYFEKDIGEELNYLLDNSSDIYTGTHFDVGAQDGNPYGITWDGTHFWVVGEANRYIYQYNSTGDYTGTNFGVFAQDSDPYGITWDGADFWVVGAGGDEVYKYTSAGVYTGTHFDVGAQDGWPCGIAWDGTYFWILGMNGDRIYKYTSAGVYTGTYFSVRDEDADPYGIEWDGTHLWVVGSQHNRVYKYTSAGVYTGVYFDIGTEDGSPWGITWDSSHFWITGDGNNEVYKYNSKYNISKNYFGGGYTYMQTNKTELISLKSIDYTTHYNLSSGDYFEVDFETNSDSEIKLELIKDGLKVKELLLSSNRMFLDENVEFSQIRFTSLFNDKDYLKIFDIKCYNVTIIEHYAEFYLEPFQSHSIYLTPFIYNLKIFEDGEIKIDKNIVISEYEPFYYIYYSEPIQCQLFLSSINGSQLDIENLHIKVNKSLYGVYSELWLSDNLFYADEGYNITFTVYDQLNYYINTFEKIADETINLEIEVYSLTIKNMMYEDTIISINSTHFFEVLSYESINLVLNKGNYQINYIDNLGNNLNFLIILDEDSIYLLNETIPESISIIYVNSDIGYNDIEWISTGDIEYVLIQLYNKSSLVEVISSKTENDGYYSWHISSNHIYNGSYRIKISDYYNNSIYDFSDYFTIEIEEPEPYEPYLPTDYWYIVRNILFFVIIPAIVGIVIVGYIFFKKKHPKEPIIQIKEIPKITYCPECGIKITDITSDYCSQCGSKIIFK